MLARLFSLLFALFLSALLLLHCGKSVSPEANRYQLPDSNLSFAEDIEPLLEYRCAESGCHSPGDLDNKLTYFELVNKSELIHHRLSTTGEVLINVPVHKSQPDQAPLYKIITVGYPDRPQDLMPPYDQRSPLTENQIAGIRQWIAEGCPD